MVLEDWCSLMWEIANQTVLIVVRFRWRCVDAQELSEMRVSFALDRESSVSSVRL